MNFNWIKKLCNKVKSLFDKTPPEPTNEELLEKFNIGRRVCENGNFDAHHLKTLITIAERLPKKPKLTQIGAAHEDFTFHSVTSLGLLESVRKVQYTRNSIIRSNLVNLTPDTKALNAWWSNDNSIEYFLIFMNDMLTYNIQMLEEDNVKIRRAVKDFLTSSLYRILMTDYLVLLERMLIGHIRHEQKKQQTTHRSN